jgi:Rps23 Pro-64 3,4-dihydroxylase Tpa1-like proline 4-hydroxylase
VIPRRAEGEGNFVSTKLQRSTEGVATARGVMPPYLLLHDFLDKKMVAGLLDYVASRQSDFTPATVISDRNELDDRSFRVAMKLRDLGEFKQVLENRILELLPKLIAELRVATVDVPKLEFELAAHGDGAFFKRHIDTVTVNNPDLKRIRVLSFVYYFNAEPKAFTGGALRLHAIGGKEGENFIDIDPIRNSLLVFLSWAPHEVTPVSCPSKRFIDSRFAINCWVWAMKPDASA